MQTFQKLFPPNTASIDTVKAGLQLPRVTRQTALFLDFDGTLVDIAPEPDQVAVPVGLTDLLGRLSIYLEGALAIVSGREIAALDRYLEPLQLPIAAQHGASHRDAQGKVTHVAAPGLRDIRRVALALANEHAGLRVEIKSAAIALHYRQAPQLEELCLLTMAEAVKRTPDVEIIHGKCVFEVKLASVSKGRAIQTFMAQAPFSGRVAVFAGDDTTDESGFPVVSAMGGECIKVGAGDSLAQYRCASPAALRRWLLSCVEQSTA